MLTLIFPFQQDAAEQCISMEFALLKKEADHIQDMSSNKVKQFADGIASFNNCSLRSYFPSMYFRPPSFMNLNKMHMIIIIKALFGSAT